MNNLLRIIIMAGYIAVGITMVLHLIKYEESIEMIDSVPNISISGLLSIDGGLEQEIAQSNLDPNSIHSISIRGHFNHNITDGKSLILWPRNLRVKLYVNDELKISTGQKDEFPSFIQYAGNSFKLFYIGEVSIKDEVRIEVEKAYASCRINVISSFFDHMYCGMENDVYQSIIEHELYHLLFGLTMTLIGILIVTQSFLQSFPKISEHYLIYYLGWFFIIGGIFYAYDSSYKYIDLIFPYPVINTLIDLLSVPTFVLFCLLFSRSAVQSKQLKNYFTGLSSVYSILALAILYLQFSGTRDLHTMQDEYLIIGGVFVLLTGVCTLYEMIKLRNRRVLKIIIATLPIMFCLSLKIINAIFDHGLDRAYLRIGILATSSLLLYFSFSYLKKTLFIVEQEEHKNLELQNAHIAIMLSQIQPHFLYNALNTLQYICKKDSVLAAEAIEHFAKYLRGNMDSLSMEHLIPFQEELEHINHYLYIEKLRFGDRIQIVYDLPYTDFYIPTLTLQPIVENAIRHGITKRPSGGTVWITTELEQNNIYIKVIDNGVGFQDNKNFDDRSHIGLINVKKRLELQCNGALTISSSKNQGTTVIICLNRNWNKDDE